MAHYYIEHSGIQTILPTHIKARSFQPGKSTILIAVLLSVLLLMSQIFSSVNLRKPSRISFIKISKSLTSLNGDRELPPCLKNFLGSIQPLAKPANTCQHLSSPRGICSLVQELFYQNTPKSCDYQESIKICESVNGKIVCSLPNECKEKAINIGVFNTSTGETVWKNVLFSELVKTLYFLAKTDSYQGYVFIKCLNFKDKNEGNLKDSDWLNDEQRDPVQLFLYPKIKSITNKIPPRNGLFNINVIMIDSLSRNHLFRSLPKSVDVLGKLKDGSEHTVIDFGYVQALKQRTYESLQALFSGYVNTDDKPFGTYSIPYEPLPLNILLNKLKGKGYRTLWLEDLCWQWEWGLPKDLKVVNKTASNHDLWRSFQNALHDAGIDAVDVTLASCDILEANKKNDPFHDSPAICFNGKYHHEYMLEYLQLYQQQLKNSDSLYFSFVQTNVAHDESGIRIQSLDDHLKKYLEFAEHLQDTVTVLFSDHGNVYGTFLEQSPEAYVETFNPFLIFIIPNKLREQIGDIRLKIMKENSQRLVSLLDVHETLLSFINESNNDRDKSFMQKYIIPGGLMSNIPETRTCQQIPLIMPNLCICKGFDITVDITETHFAYSEFSVGVINNLILAKRFHNGDAGFGKCEMLRVKDVRSVRESRIKSDVTVVKLDVEVSTVLSSQSELLFFIVEVGAVEPSIKLVSYERNSVYGRYRTCVDENVDLKMCSCNVKDVPDKSLLFRVLFPDFLSIGGQKESKDFAEKQIRTFFEMQAPQYVPSVEEVYPIKRPCLFLFLHKYQNSFNMFSMNLCSFIDKVTLKISSENLYLSADAVSSHLLRPLDLKLLISGSRANSLLKWSWTYDVDIV